MHFIKQLILNMAPGFGLKSLVITISEKIEHEICTSYITEESEYRWAINVIE